MFVKVNDARLYVDIDGAGLVPEGRHMRQKPTVILAHGGPGADHSLYKPAYAQLSDIAQVVYYDHRGNGRSDLCAQETWNLAQWGDDLRGLCDALGIEKPIVCGTSFGGFVAQSYATRYPDHPAKLILISTAAKMDFEAVFAAFEALGGADAGQAARAYWTSPTSQTRARFREICVPLFYVSDVDTSDWLSRIVMRDETALWFNGPNNEQGRMDFREDLAKIACPVLLMAGESDPITPIAFSEMIAECLPPDLVTFLRFAQCGHDVVVDQPGAAFKAIRDFIEAA